MANKKVGAHPIPRKGAFEIKVQLDNKSYSRESEERVRRIESRWERAPNKETERSSE